MWPTNDRNKIKPQQACLSLLLCYVMVTLKVCPIAMQLCNGDIESLCYSYAVM